MPISPALKVFAWLSFLAEVVIIGTGGAVRLTGSGLGCSEWPLCTPDSLVPTAAMGIHGIIEFGNRTMTGLVGILALAVLLLALHAAGGRRSLLPAVLFAVGGIVLAVGAYVAFTAAGASGAVPMSVVLLVAAIAGAVHSLIITPVRRDLLTLAWIVLVGVMAQAVVGGSAVLTGLNPFVVGFHYASSLALVCVTAAFLVRMSAVTGPRELAVPRGYAILVHITSLVLALTIAFGVLTTANGPHSGDEYVQRDGFDASVLAHVHSWPGYALAVLALVIAGVAWARDLPTRAWSGAFVGALAIQIFVGIWQANTALPPFLVGVHMVLASLTAAAYVVVVLRLKRPAAHR
ncbi:COX15/CtaA family protein [Microbacterium karelineae]|uniref:COX15/CtaA family protein n=1 Tax=Microbacterium karelineae TaxID=2654283 RepID=UPI001E5D90B1|nr:COX15/CtaA family protein [Microbacterium karelineae]